MILTKEQEGRIQYLVKEIKRHRYLYYNQQPEISDTKYDALEDELQELDPENPILFKIYFLVLQAWIVYLQKENI